MKKILLRAFKSNSHLANYTKGTSHLQTVAARRSAVAIGVIDDEIFAPQTNLQSYGYKITPIGDLKQLSEVAAYHIVLCDIMGVGRHFDKSMQGASLIAEIKKELSRKDSHCIYRGNAK